MCEKLNKFVYRTKYKELDTLAPMDGNCCKYDVNYVIHFLLNLSIMCVVKNQRFHLTKGLHLTI